MAHHGIMDGTYRHGRDLSASVRLSTQDKCRAVEKAGRRESRQEETLPQIVAVAAAHCGAACTLGDIVAAWIHFVTPVTIAGVAIFGPYSQNRSLLLVPNADRNGRRLPHELSGELVNGTPICPNSLSQVNELKPLTAAASSGFGGLL